MNNSMYMYLLIKLGNLKNQASGIFEEKLYGYSRVIEFLSDILQ